MAYLIFFNNTLHKIAANDAEKNSFTFPNPDEFITKPIPDADYINVKSYVKSASLSGEEVVYGDLTITFKNAEELRNYLDNTKTYLLQVQNEQVIEHPEKEAIIAYANYLDTVDTSTIIPNIETPLNSSWEKYCLDNSITFFHALQIP